MNNEKQLRQDFGVRFADLRVIGALAWTNGRGESRSGVFDHYYTTAQGQVFSCFQNGIDKRWRWRKLRANQGCVKMKPGLYHQALRVPLAAIRVSGGRL